MWLFNQELINQPTNSWQGVFLHIRSLGKDIPPFMESKVHHRLHKSLQSEPILRQLVPVHIVTPCSSIFPIYAYSSLSSISLMHAMCPTHLILINLIF
jgi:hypothetical protein